MILVNTDYIAGQELEMLGLVKGSTIQSKNIGRDITQGFKTLVGGELGAYTDMMNDARALATKRMVGEAEHLGADAVVNVRYASAAVVQGAAEVMAYGTAVSSNNAACKAQALPKTSRLGEGRFVGALAPKQSGREPPPPGKSLLLSGGGGYTPAAVTISKKHAISGLIHLLL